MSSESSFSRVLRGYDPQQVDALVQKLRRELLAAKTLHDDTLNQLKALEERVAELELELGNQASPTPAGLTAQLAKKFAQADKQARQIILNAESDALLIRSAAEKTSSQFIESAREGYEQVRAEALQNAHELREEATAEAEDIISSAQAEADRIIAEAQAEAKNIHGDSSTLSAKMRAESRNEASRIIADAKREAAELRLVLVAGRDKGVTVSDEIMQILKLNADGAAVRAQMEHDIEQRHQESVLQTDKYLASAEAQLAISRTAQRELEAQLAAQENTADKDAQHIIEQARKKAAATEDAATTHARKIIADAEKYVAAVLASIYTQLEDIRLERESVASFFDALRLELEKTLPVAPRPTKRATKKELSQ